MIDTHCHLDLPPLREQLDPLLEEARSVGITQWIVPSVGPDSWERIVELCSQYPGVRPAYGLHPKYAVESWGEYLHKLNQIAAQGVAVGEIGLDATLDNLEQQTALFREQLRIARRHGLPVLVHCRKAMGRTIEILREERAAEFGGIMHAFSGSVESARDCIRMGFVISLSATLTRPNAVRPLQLARELPLSQLVIETDAPDLAPFGHRSAYNRPVRLIDVAQALAKVRGCSLQEIAVVTANTALRVIPRL